MILEEINTYATPSRHKEISALVFNSGVDISTSDMRSPPRDNTRER